MKLPSRYITCPRCGEQVRIPTFWIVGVEGIFRCGGCKLTLKTGYRMGAVLFALALVLSLVCVQLLIYIFSSYSLPLMILLIIPLWLFFGFIMRRAYMMAKIKRALFKQVQK